MRHLFLIVLLGLILFLSYVMIKDAPNRGTFLPPAKLTQPSFDPFPYQIPKLPVKQSYLTYLIGDSMVASMGPNANGLRLNLISYYPDYEFVNYNYGFSSTNMLGLNDLLFNETSNEQGVFPAVLKQGFDFIIIESFAYNPLSEFPVEEGLKKYEEVLNSAVLNIIKHKPGAVLALMTPIAPNKENFAKNSRDLSPEVRLEWVSEREAYIDKLIEYAKSKNIPLINVYEMSLDENGNGDLKYIDSHDYIHPSKEGIRLMEKAIADFIYQNRIFP